MTEGSQVPPGAAVLVLVVMGVAGSGKSTTGRLLAEALDCDFLDADDLHPAANRTKMAAGHPLTDADREPWLAAVAGWIDEHIAAGRCGVIPCSALKRRYRDVLRRPEVAFVYLDGPYELIADRMRRRHGHFMPVALLDSQFATLEPPAPDEHTVVADISLTPAEQVEGILRVLTPESGGP